MRIINVGRTAERTVLGASATKPIGNLVDCNRGEVKLMRVGTSSVGSRIITELTQGHGFALSTQSYDNVQNGFRQLALGGAWRSDCNAVLIFGTNREDDQAALSITSMFKEICPNVMIIYSNPSHSVGSYGRMNPAEQRDKVDICIIGDGDSGELAVEIDEFMKHRSV